MKQIARVEGPLVKGSGEADLLDGCKDEESFGGGGFTPHVIEYSDEGIGKGYKSEGRGHDPERYHEKARTAEGGKKVGTGEWGETE